MVTSKRNTTEPSSLNVVWDRSPMRSAATGPCEASAHTTATFANLDRFVTRYPGAVGVKNGYTSVAGNCVAAAATRDGKTLIVVALNGPRIYDTASQLMDAGFATATIGTWHPDPLPSVAEAVSEKWPRIYGVFHEGAD